MDLVFIINVHDNSQTVRDTIDAVKLWGSDDIVLSVDGLAWSKFSEFNYRNVIPLRGVDHGINRSPYKNMTLGLSEAYNKWPDKDWYCYMEYDVLILSDLFKYQLEIAARRGVSCVGFEHGYTAGSNDAWLLSKLFDKEINYKHKMIGCFMCFSNACMKFWDQHNFFGNLLTQTASYSGADFPNFTDYAVEEILFPTAASLAGPLLTFNAGCSQSSRYLVRFMPEVTQNEITNETTIVHPIKSFTNPIRQHYAAARMAFQ